MLELLLNPFLFLILILILTQALFLFHIKERTFVDFWRRHLEFYFILVAWTFYFVVKGFLLALAILQGNVVFTSMLHSIYNHWPLHQYPYTCHLCTSKHVSFCKKFQLKCSAQRRCEYIDLHNVLVAYNEAWAFQKALVKQKKEMIERNEKCPDTLIILQHPPVYTLGTGSSQEYLNFNLKDPPCDVIRTERGGEVTYHGPGQLVMYPIINLRNHKMDLHWYLRALEEVVIRVLFSTFAIEASRIEGFTGAWFGKKKLAAIGIRVSHWLTYHGLALNVSVDLTPFKQIVPCGIKDREVGSIKQLLREFQTSHNSSSMDQFDADDSLLIDIAHKSLIQEFSEVFQLELDQVSLPISNRGSTPFGLTEGFEVTV